MTQNDETVKENIMPVTEASDVKSDAFSDVYGKTVEALGGITSERFYSDILSALKNGNATAELRKRTMLRAIDETWVNAIEDSLQSIEVLIRNPRKYIEEQEYILPISQSKAITPRSVRHLAQHVDYISEVTEDSVTPTKILNVFREETMQTYENKFVNTLIQRLAAFVSKRYSQTKARAVDTVATKLTFTDDFSHGDIKCRVNFTMEVDEPAKDTDNIEKNYVFSSDLWRRVEKLYHVCMGYTKSEFAKNMGDSYIHPPILHTNAIMKNRDFRQCLALWEFIESYENCGYTLLVDEHLESIDGDYIKALYQSVAVEYLLFREKVHGGFDESKTLDKSAEPTLYTPHIVDKLVPAPEEEFDAHYGLRVPQACREHELTELDHRILDAIDESITEAEKQQKLADFESMVSFRRSFLARIIQATDTLQNYYSEIKNGLLSYTGVKSKIFWDGEAFTLGRNRLAYITVRGKTLTVYFALSPADYSERVHCRNAAEKSPKFEKTPLEIRISGERMLKEALSIIPDLMSEKAEKNSLYTAEDFGMPYETDGELIADGLIKVINGEIPADAVEKNDEIKYTGADSDNLGVTLRRSFESKLIQSDENIQGFYSGVKNALLSYKGVRARMSFGYETFNVGRKKIAKISFRGKKPAVSIALDPASEEISKYRFKVQADKSLPVLSVVSSPRALKYTIGLIEAAAKAENLAAASSEKVDYIYENKSDEELIAAGLIKTVKGKAETENLFAVPYPATYECTLDAALTLAGDEIRTIYNNVRNSLASGTGVKIKNGKYYETFTVGRKIISRLSVKNGRLTCFIALENNDFSIFACPHRTFEAVEYLKDTPVAVEITSSRVAELLIRVIKTRLFAEYGILPNKDFKPENITFAPKTLKQLFEEGLVTGEIPEEPKPEPKYTAPITAEPVTEEIPPMADVTATEPKEKVEETTEAATETAEITETPTETEELTTETPAKTEESTTETAGEIINTPKDSADEIADTSADVEKTDVIDKIFGDSAIDEDDEDSGNESFFETIIQKIKGRKNK